MNRMRSKQFLKYEVKTAAVLAGGKSSRFGSNKALASWRNGNVIDAVTSAIRAISDELFIVTNEPAAYKYMGLPIIKDDVINAGPIGGLLTALKNARGNRVFIAACDMPLLNSGLIQWMWDIETLATVVIPRTANGLEPLHAIYHRSLIPLLEHSIRHNQLSLQRFLAGVSRYEISSKDITKFCPDFSCLKSANTKNELETLRQSHD
ncbi:MAG: molybdenum cofactor guanylyltransferase [Dissulfurimicrobium sp.]|uniref:molybdenum cofactor guanylyltransferase n=1 Tax=Dissulfurimicrobium sp. TaxID=2022436 RepID=UPI00404B4946